MMAYGVGIFAQGGMGTEYAADSFMAAGSGDKARSELSVGRLVIPFVMEVDKKTKVGGEPRGRLGRDGSQDAHERVAVHEHDAGTEQYLRDRLGTMISGFQSYMAGGIITGLNWGRFDFSNSSDFTGEARGYGVAAKVGRGPQG